MKEQIDAAIAAHAMWKFKLKSAINGGDLPESAAVRLDNRCDFGKWLYALAPAGAEVAHHAQVKQLHAEFHRAAAAVVSDLEAGRSITEDAALGKGSAFFAASSKLTQALIGWKTAG